MSETTKTRSKVTRVDIGPRLVNGTPYEPLPPAKPIDPPPQPKEPPPPPPEPNDLATWPGVLVEHLAQLTEAVTRLAATMELGERVELMKLEIDGVKAQVEGLRAVDSIMRRATSPRPPGGHLHLVGPERS